MVVQNISRIHTPCTEAVGTSKSFLASPKDQKKAIPPTTRKIRNRVAFTRLLRLALLENVPRYTEVRTLIRKSRYKITPRRSKDNNIAKVIIIGYRK
jgi:hypothetical protein